jgi:protoporphyrinogen oxidase
VVGGLSRTVRREDWRFDIGGHRFFTKVAAVRDLWHEILPAEDFLARSRLSRIYYDGKFYDYPIRPLNALANLGPVEAARCVGSYVWARLRPPEDGHTLEGYITANYGRRLYEHFFKTYNEKVWGVPASELSADWGAQRIKGMSLFAALWEPTRARLFGSRADPTSQVTSLIDEFEYPRLGPGMMWERCHELVTRGGGVVHMSSAVCAMDRGPDGRVRSITTTGAGGPLTVHAGEVVSSMPLSGLVRAMTPAAPAEVQAAADALGYRDFLVVALVVPERSSFPDNWIYVHQRDVRVGRIQNFGAWSPSMVLPGTTCLGLEYFVSEGDDLWKSSDEALVARATDELVRIGLGRAGEVERGFVVRMTKAYPVYDDGYRAAVETIRHWLDRDVGNVHPVGRNGMHKYNNQDHSMYTAMLTVENIVSGADHDIWSVNVDEAYHEAGIPSVGRSSDTGRDAPVVPRHQPVATTGPAR